MKRVLLPVLQNSSYDADVFASINDVDYEYYDKVRMNLSPWLKGLYVSPYSFPERFSTLEIFVEY
jgi:hypothetical protein